jgi:hypothetical protein
MPKTANNDVIYYICVSMKDKNLLLHLIDLPAPISDEKNLRNIIGCKAMSLDGYKVNNDIIDKLRPYVSEDFDLDRYSYFLSCAELVDTLREDIYEFVRLNKILDTDDVLYEDMMHLYIGFCNEILFAHDALEELKICKTCATICRYLVEQAADFLDKKFSLPDLEKLRILTWDLHYSLAKRSAEARLFRVIVCLLYDEEFDNNLFDRYGSSMYFGGFYSVLLDLHHTYCKQFTDYVSRKYRERQRI